MIAVFGASCAALFRAYGRAHRRRLGLGTVKPGHYKKNQLFSFIFLDNNKKQKKETTEKNNKNNYTININKYTIIN